MDSRSSSSIITLPACHHMVALPYPGQHHVNPMLALNKILASKSSRLLTTFVGTEEWLSLPNGGYLCSWQPVVCHNT
ncbi:hypothetical protein MLD38_012573 [Melastoma candidum]|uniref:Uncharacterized protein n=1 Tax=Melastoma candidum TaxID=119954 RepID=A0ACB9R6S3_9MYRT|nr:hypothetical protein MLD38_012573 [Melastoma candidum]